MTRNSRSTLEPVDESWVAHLRDLSSDVAPPTSANPHAMSRVAIRRTRNRRAVLTTGGGVLTVAAVAGAAFALNGPTPPGALVPGGSASVPTSASKDSKPAAAEELQGSAPGSVPDGWNVHELEGLTYALPSEIVANGPVQDEPGETSDMWHSREDPDSPPFLRIAYVTPDNEFYDSKAGGLTQTPGPGATSFDLPGSSLASVEEGTDALFEAAGGDPDAKSSATPVRILVHRADGPGRYVITMNLPAKDSDLVDTFIDTLTVD